MTPGNCWSRRISLSLRFLLKCTATQKYEFATCLLARTASRCWRAYILLHCFFFFLFSFFFCLSMPNRGAQSSLNTYSVITAIWIMWSEFPSYLTPRSGGIKLFFCDWLWTLTKHISATEHDVNNRKGTCQSTATPIHTSPNLVNIGPETAENGWRVFVHPLNFRIGRHCLPYRMDVI